MNYNAKMLPVVLPMILIASLAGASSEVKVYPTQPVDCRQVNELNVMNLDASYFSEDAQNIYLHVEASRHVCASGIYKPMTIETDPGQAIILMKDGFKFPWDFRAPAQTVAYKIPRNGGEVIVADFTFEKGVVFANKSRRNFELILRTGFNEDPYVWGITLLRRSDSFTDIIMKQK